MKCLYAFLAAICTIIKQELLYSRDAISKALYSRLFTWLVERINLIVCRAERDRSTSLAVLDIFGFEVSISYISSLN